MGFTYTVSTEHNNYENLTVYDRYYDDTFSGWQVIPNDGYVMYRSDANDVELSEDGNEIPVTYYYTNAGLPAIFNWDNFTWVAVPRSEVDENYIFGAPTTPPVTA